MEEENTLDFNGNYGGQSFIVLAMVYDKGKRRKGSDYLSH